MIITCKACQKRYLLENEDIGSEGRKVRCVACGNSWQQYRIKENVRNILSKSPTFDPGYSIDARSSKKFPLSYIAGIVFILFCSLYVGRYSIVARWPESEKIFTIFKIPAHYPFEGLSLENIVPMQVTYQNQKGYALKGDLHNESNNVKSIPALEIIAQGDCQYARPLARLYRLFRKTKAKLSGHDLKDGHLCILESWSYRLQETKILPGEKISFETPPRPDVMGAENISIEF